MGTSPAWSSSQPWLLSGEGLGLCQTLRDSGHCSSEWAAAHPDELGVGFFLPSFPKPFLSPPLTKSWSSEGNLFSPPLCSECSTSYQPTRRPDCSHLGKSSFKKSQILWKTFIRWWPPPPPIRNSDVQQDWCNEPHICHFWHIKASYSGPKYAILSL